MTRHLKCALAAFALSVVAASPRQGQAQNYVPDECDYGAGWWDCANHRNEDIDWCVEYTQQGPEYDHCVCQANNWADWCVSDYDSACLNHTIVPCT